MLDFCLPGHLVQLGLPLLDLPQLRLGLLRAERLLDQRSLRPHVQLLLVTEQVLVAVADRGLVVVRGR